MSLNGKVKKELLNSKTLKEYKYKKCTDYFYTREYNESIMGIDIQFYRDRYTANIGIHPSKLKALWCYAEWIGDKFNDCSIMALHGRIHHISRGIDNWFDSTQFLESHLSEANQYLEVVEKSYKDVLKKLTPEKFIGKGYEEIQVINTSLYKMCPNTIDAIYLIVYFWPERYFEFKEIIHNNIESKPVKVKPIYHKAFDNLIQSLS